MKHARPDEITAVLDGALSPEREKRLRGHIAGCGRCRHLEAKIRQERDLADRASRALNPPGFPLPVDIPSPAADRARYFSAPTVWFRWRALRIAAVFLLFSAAALSAVLILSGFRRHSGVSYSELVEHGKRLLPGMTSEGTEGQPLLRSVHAGGRPALAYIVSDPEAETTFVWIERSLEKDDYHEKID